MRPIHEVEHERGPHRVVARLLPHFVQRSEPQSAFCAALTTEPRTAAKAALCQELA